MHGSVVAHTFTDRSRPHRRVRTKADDIRQSIRPAHFPVEAGRSAVIDLGNVARIAPVFAPTSAWEVGKWAARLLKTLANTSPPDIFGCRVSLWSANVGIRCGIFTDLVTCLRQRLNDIA